MKTHLLSPGLSLAQRLGDQKKSRKKLLSRATCFVIAIYGLSAILPVSSNAKGLLDNLFGTSKVQRKTTIKPIVVNCALRTGQNQSRGNNGNRCLGDNAANGGFTIITASGFTVRSGGTSLPPGGTVTQVTGTNIALSSTVSLNGSVTVPGGGSLNVANTLSVNNKIHVHVSTAPMSAAGFGGGMAIGSASSIGAGSANSSSFGNGDSFSGVANSGTSLGSSGGSGGSLGGGLGMGGGFGMSGSIN